MRRGDPETRLCAIRTIDGRDRDQRPFSVDTTTINLSPPGAIVLLDRPLYSGAVVDYTASYGFRARARVTSIVMDAERGTYIVALEYLDNARIPVVVWPAEAA